MGVQKRDIKRKYERRMRKMKINPAYSKTVFENSK